MKIYSDNAIEYNWFKNLNIAYDNLEYHLIKGRGKNPRIVEEVIKYDRPDIILCDEKKVYLVIEKTREVPTGHNVGQRMARLIRSVELEIPAIFICPFKAGTYPNIAYASSVLPAPLKPVRVRISPLNKSKFISLNP